MIIVCTSIWSHSKCVRLSTIILIFHPFFSSFSCESKDWFHLVYFYLFMKNILQKPTEVSEGIFIFLKSWMLMILFYPKLWFFYQNTIPRWWAFWFCEHLRPILFYFLLNLFPLFKRKISPIFPWLFWHSLSQLNNWKSYWWEWCYFLIILCTWSPQPSLASSNFRYFLKHLLCTYLNLLLT